MITRLIMSIILNMSTVMARLQFRTLLMARASIWIAGAITAVALPMAVYQRTGRADLAALLAGFIVTPYIVVGLFAGALADRHRIRSVALLTTSACALAFGSIPVAQMLGVLTTPHLFVSALVANTALVFFDAAMFAALPAIVGRDRIAEAFASMTAVSTVIGLGGPALGGLIAGWWSPEYTLTISAVMFVVSAVVFLILDEPVRELSHRETTILRDIGAGLGFIVRNRIVRSLTLLGLGNSIAEGVLQRTGGRHGLGVVRHDVGRAVSGIRVLGDDGRRVPRRADSPASGPSCAYRHHHDARADRRGGRPGCVEPAAVVLDRFGRARGLSDRCDGRHPQPA